MSVLIIEIADRERVERRFIAASQGEYQGEFVTFPDLELLHKVMTPKRWAILDYLQRHGAMRLRALAQALAVDVGNLQRDIKPLKEYGMVTDTEAGLAVPYDEIRLELVLSRAA